MPALHVVVCSDAAHKWTSFVSDIRCSPFMHESCTNAYTLLTYVCILFVLYAAYNRRGGVYSFLRLVMALPFLPLDMIT
jgi:hypothetical protein